MSHFQLSPNYTSLCLIIEITYQTTPVEYNKTSMHTLLRKTNFLWNFLSSFKNNIKISSGVSSKSQYKNKNKNKNTLLVKSNNNMSTKHTNTTLVKYHGELLAIHSFISRLIPKYQNTT